LLKKLFFSILLCNISLIHSPIFSSDLTILSGDIKPVYSEEQNNLMTTNLNNSKIGIATLIVSKALTRNGIKFDLEWKPWIRTYNEGLENKNKKTFIIPLTRIEEREKLFVWCSKIYSSNSVFITLKDSKKINSFKDAKDLRIGTMGGSSYLMLLKRPENGIKEENIEVVTFDTRAFNMLIGKRIDAWFALESSAVRIIRESNKSVDLFQIGKHIHTQDNYIGTTSKTSPELIKKVSNAIESFKKTQEYNKILEEFGNTIEH